MEQHVTGEQGRFRVVLGEPVPAGFGPSLGHLRQLQPADAVHEPDHGGEIRRTPREVGVPARHGLESEGDPRGVLGGPPQRGREGEHVRADQPFPRERVESAALPVTHSLHEEHPGLADDQGREVRAESTLSAPNLRHLTRVRAEHGPELGSGKAVTHGAVTSSGSSQSPAYRGCTRRRRWTRTAVRNRWPSGYPSWPGSWPPRPR